MASVFYDDFNRANSNTVGNGWSEIDLIDDVGIVSNRLQFPYTGTDGDAAVVHRDISTWGYNNITVQFIYRKDSAATGADIDSVSVQHDGITRNAGAGGLHININYGGNSVAIVDGTTALASASYTFNTNTNYYFKWDINSDNSQRLYIKTGDFNFTSSNLILTVSAFTPSTTYTRLALGNRFYAQYDSIELFSPVEPAAPSVVNYTITCAVGSYTLTGISATLRKALNMILSAGSYTLTGISATLRRGYTLIANTGSYVLTGISVSLKKALKLALSAGSYVYTGVAATLIKELGIIAQTLGINLTFNSFSIGGQRNETKNSTTLTNTSKNSTTLTNTSKNSTTLTNLNK